MDISPRQLNFWHVDLKIFGLPFVSDNLFLIGKIECGIMSLIYLAKLCSQSHYVILHDQIMHTLCLHGYFQLYTSTCK